MFYSAKEVGYVSLEVAGQNGSVSKLTNDTGPTPSEWTKKDRPISNFVVFEPRDFGLVLKPMVSAIGMANIGPASAQSTKLLQPSQIHV